MTIATEVLDPYSDSLPVLRYVMSLPGLAMEVSLGRCHMALPLSNGEMVKVSSDSKETAAVLLLAQRDAEEAKLSKKDESH